MTEQPPTSPDFQEPWYPGQVEPRSQQAVPQGEPEQNQLPSSQVQEPSRKTGPGGWGLITALGVAVLAIVAVLINFAILPLFSESSESSGVPVITDIPESPSEVWTATFDAVAGEPYGLLALDAGDDRTLVATEFYSESLYHMLFSMVDLEDGSVVWNSEIESQVWWEVLAEPGSRFVGTVTVPSDAVYSPGGLNTYEILMFSNSDGTSRSIEIEAAAVQAALKDDALYVLLAEDAEGSGDVLRRYNVKSLDRGAVWEVSTQSSGDLCVAQGMLMVGEVYSSRSECFGHGVVGAYDLSSGGLLGWSSATSESNHAWVSENGRGILLYEFDEESRSVEFMLMDPRGADVWNSAIRVTDDFSAAPMIFGNTLYLSTTSEGLLVFDLGTGEPLWESPVPDVTGVLGELGEQTVVRTNDSIQWLDRSTGEIKNSLDVSNAFALAQSDEQVFVQVDFKEIVAFHADGEARWSFALPESQYVQVVGSRLILIDDEAMTVSGLR